LNLPSVIIVAIQPRVAADGGTTSLGEIITRLRRHRPIVVADRESWRVAEWREGGIEVHIIPQSASRGFIRNPIGTIRSYSRFARGLWRLIKSSGAKVVHANDPLAMQLSIIPAKLSRAKLIFNLRGTFRPQYEPSRRKYAALFAAADHIFYLSEDMASRWRNLARKWTPKHSVTYSVVDRSRFRPLPSDKHEPIVLVSGLIRPLKGQLEFIRHVAPTLVANDVKVWFAGDFNPAGNPYMAACAEAAAPLGDSVQFLGYRSDISELTAKAAVVAVPSFHEGLVRAMIEAMSCARPVVSFDVCSAREILETQAGGAGTVVEPGDHAAMANAILQYCREPELAAKAGARGQAAALRLFDATAVVARYEQVYDRLSAGPQAAT
jgi:glycosyltransferase involved in cell wall biosynthesis